MKTIALANAIAEKHEIKLGVAAMIISKFAEVGFKEVTSTGKFIFPALFTIKTRVKPARKACKKEIFGKMCDLEAKPAKTIVKATPARALISALKKSV